MSESCQQDQTLQVIPMRAEHARQVARLHIDSIQQGFLSALGEDFVTALYETLAVSTESFGYVAVTEDGGVVGFVSFTTNLRRLYRSVLRKRGLTFTTLLIRKVCSFSVLKRILETLFYPKRIARLRLPEAELLSTGVSEQWRGRKIAQRLIERGFQECAARGIERIKVLVADFNDVANHLYRKTGFRLATQIVNHGIVSNVYVAPIRRPAVCGEPGLVIRPMRLEDIEQVVNIHRFCFPASVSLFSVLNPHVVWHLYAQYVEEKDSFGVVLVDETLGFVAGYAAGTLKPGIQRRFLKRHWFLVGWYLLLAMAAHPSLIGRVVRAMFKKERFEEYRRHPELFETTYPAGPVGYFMPIAVHPDYRGGGNAVRVARALMEEFFKRGVVRIRGNKIDIHNLASQKLFVDKLGWNSVVIENESVVVWVDKPEASGPGEAPACPVRRTLSPLPSVFITYGWCRSSYAILLSLGRRGVKVHVGDSSPLAMSRFSRYAASFSRLPDFFVEPERYIDCLLEALKKTGAEVLLACHEDVGLVSRYRERFPSHIRMAVPSWESYQAAEDKLRLMEIASQYGCPVPRTYAAAEGELEKLSKELAFPVVLKTRIGNSAKGVAIAHHAEELKEKYRFLAETYHLTGERLPFLQEFLPGRAAGVCAVYDQGRPLAFFAEEYLRCKEPGRFGTSTLRRTLEEPALVESGRRVLDGLKWHGLVHLDFIQDAEGVYRLIELNPRPWGAMALAIYAGVDFPWLWYRLAAGEKLTFADIKPAKIMCRWILGDFLAFGNRLRSGLWREAAQILRRHSDCYHDDFTWTDPFPFFAQNLDYLVKYIRAGGRMNPVTKNMVR